MGFQFHRKCETIKTELDVTEPSDVKYKLLIKKYEVTKKTNKPVQLSPINSVFGTEHGNYNSVTSDAVPGYWNNIARTVRITSVGSRPSTNGHLGIKNKTLKNRIQNHTSKCIALYSLQNAFTYTSSFIPSSFPSIYQKILYTYTHPPHHA